MKASSFILLAGLTACSLIDAELPLGRPRIFEESFRKRGRGQDGDSASSGPDTVFYVSAVTFPRSYDWRRDTAFGATACTLKLYKGLENVVSLPAGPVHRISSSPDRNHLIGNDLISEFSDGSGTVVKLNGTEICHWTDRETLTGILLKDSVLHTIGRGPSSQWYTYRKDGVPLIKIDNGSVFGGFDCDTYGPTGAIYEDGEAVCFAYQTVTAGIRSAYLVRDGKAGLLLSSPSADFLDVKQLNGSPAILYNDSGASRMSYKGNYINITNSGKFMWTSAEVLWFEGRPTIMGRYYSVGDGRKGFAMSWINTFRFLPAGADFFYYGPGEEDCIAFSLPRPGWEEYYFFNHNCACLLNGELAAVLTPKSAGCSPFLAYRKDTLKYNIHGFLAGITVQITE